ncbi:hypothetical protein JCM14036_11240 [Desulfotomaculum defluvii]
MGDDNYEIIREAYEQAVEEYNKALGAEITAEIAMWGNGAATVAAGAAATLCWAGLEAPSLGLATGVCVAATAAAVAEGVQTSGAIIQEELAEEAREDAEWYMEWLEEIYCFYLEHGSFHADLGEPPEIPEITIPEPDEMEYPLEDCCE